MLLGLLGIVLAPWVLFRVVPALLPYAGQETLDTLRFSLVIEDKKGDELQVLPLDSGLRRVFQPLGKLPLTLVRTVLAERK